MKFSPTTSYKCRWESNVGGKLKMTLAEWSPFGINATVKSR